jgi:hypothetical protein
MRRHHPAPTAVVVAACLALTIGGAEARDAYRLESREVSGVAVTFPVLAKRQSAEMPLDAFPVTVPFDSVDASPRGEFSLYRAMWDWDRSVFSDGPRSLAMTVSAHAYRGTFNLACRKDFEAFAQEFVVDSNAFQEGSDPRFREAYRLGAWVDDGPVPIARVDGAGAVRSVELYAPLDSRHYLTVRFRLHPVGSSDDVAGLSRRDREWLGQMHEAVEHMIRGVRVSGVAQCPGEG